MRLTDAAEDREVLVDGVHALDKRREVPGEAIADAIDLVVTGIEEAPVVERIVELECLHLFDGVGFEREKGRHRLVELLADGGAEAGADGHFGLVVAQDLERPDVRIHVRADHLPVEIVVAVDIGVGSEAEFVRQRLRKLPQKKSLMGTRSGSW